MSKIKLTYFDLTGRGEPSRLALAIGGVEFEDERIGFPEFGKKKQEGGFPYGSVPTLTVGDVTLAQSNSILRYCGKLAKLYPTDNLQAAKVDELIDAAEDVLPKIYQALFEKNEETKKQLLEKLNKEILPQWVGFIEKRVGSKGFSVGDSTTIADLKLYATFAGIAFGVPFFKDLNSSTFDNAPNLKTIFGTVHNIPKVVEWNKTKNKIEYN
eukprot:TRINITY_DN15199_c0_g1_i1.p1 TRINITY_DN15199_c0_g1~~TRINITY_DN15199_c0_g1_i1.p1  ORF type:complete len:220 (-),score=90.44 TRINITY_DN15199_c0_g1_i1:19-654(-)